MKNDAHSLSFPKSRLFIMANPLYVRVIESTHILHVSTHLNSGSLLMKVSQTLWSTFWHMIALFGVGEGFGIPTGGHMMMKSQMKKERMKEEREGAINA